MSKWLHKPPKKETTNRKNPFAGFRLPKPKPRKQKETIKDLDRYRQHLKRRKIGSFLLAIVFVVILIAVLATAFFTGKFTEFFYNARQFQTDDSYPVAIKEQSFADAAGLDRYLSVMTKNGVIFLDNKGGRADEQVLGYASPVLRHNRRGVLIYDHGGTQFSYIQPFQPGFSLKSEQKIITGAISETGNCAIAAYHDQYAAEVTVYNTNGTVAYRWASASDKVISISFDSDGKRLYVCCVNAKDGFLQTIVYALNTSSEKEIYRSVLSDSVSPLYLHPMSGGRVAVVTTSSIEFLNSSGAVVNASYYYSDLYAVCGNEKYLAVAQQNVYNNTTSLIVYNSDGDRVNSLDITDIPLQIAIDGSSLFCLTDRELINWGVTKNTQTFLTPDENFSGMVLFDDTVFLYNNNNIDRAEHTVSAHKEK